MNLPRNERNKQSNVLLVGIIPDPSEPTNLNGFLAPLVKELNELWEVWLGVIQKQLLGVICFVLHVTCQLAVNCVVYFLIMHIKVVLAVQSRFLLAMADLIEINGINVQELII